MENERVVEITRGKVKLRKPLAGPRNKALMKAELADGMRATVFLVEIMPEMIVEHPFGAEPINTALDSLSIDDYDKLAEVVKDLIGFGFKGDTEKKLEEPSSPKDSPEKNGSETSS